MSHKGLVAIVTAVILTEMVILFPFPRVSGAAGGTTTPKCCKKSDSTACSGCQSYTLGYLQHGTNTVYDCVDSTDNTHKCKTEFVVCFEGKQLPYFNKSDCTQPNGKKEDLTANYFGCDIKTQSPCPEPKKDKEE